MDVRQSWPMTTDVGRCLAAQVPGDASGAARDGDAAVGFPAIGDGDGQWSSATNLIGQPRWRLLRWDDGRDGVDGVGAKYVQRSRRLDDG